MTKEQAIEILECFKNNEIQRDKLEIDNRCGGWKIGKIYKSLELNTAIETVLSIVEERDLKLIDENNHLNDLLNALETYYNITQEDLENSIKLDV